MSRSEVSKSEAAEERSEQTRSFVRTVKAAARRKYTPEEKIRIVLDLLIPLPPEPEEPSWNRIHVSHCYIRIPCLSDSS